GDIDGNDVTDERGVLADAEGLMGSNSYTVVTGSGADASAKLDGFIITGGNADGSSEEESPLKYGGGIYNVNGSPALANLVIQGNYALEVGGNYNSNTTTVLKNVTIRGNAARDGAGMFNREANPALINVTISVNSAEDYGGGLFDNNSSTVLTNVTVVGNTAGEGAGGGILVSFGSNVNIHNAIVWGNIAPAGPQVEIMGSGVVSYAYSLVEGVSPEGEGNLSGDADPLFANAEGDDYTLSVGSPA